MSFKTVVRFIKKNLNNKNIKMELTPINDFEFQKKLKGCGIKYYSKMPRTELKALLGFCPTRKAKKKLR